MKKQNEMMHFCVLN